MADPTTPGAPEPAPEPPKAADAAQKKQTVRISLPPKPAAGPSIKIPAPGTPAAASPAAAPMAQSAAAPAAPAARPAGAPTAAARPSPAPAPASAPVAQYRPAAAAVSPLEIGLAFATVAIGIGIVIRLLTLVPAAS